MTEIDAAIAEITGIRGDVRRVWFAADIVGETGEDDVEWVFIKGGVREKVTLPRAAFRLERERGVNFWLVEMAEPLARHYAIDHLAITDAEAAEHRERIAASWRSK